MVIIKEILNIEYEKWGILDIMIDLSIEFCLMITFFYRKIRNI